MKMVDNELSSKINHTFSEYKMKQYLPGIAQFDIPILFLVSKKDKLVKAHHGEKLFQRYQCDKKIL